MVETKKKRYVQVNIYGRTLQDFEQEGFELRGILNHIGCSDVWIGEGVLYIQEQDDMNMVVDANAIEVAGEEEVMENKPFLSTTIADVKVPRCSTKIISQQFEPPNFTFNMTEKLSKILSKYEKEQERIIEEVVNQLVNTVSSPKPLPIYSTTVGKSHLPRSSTPIASSVKLHKKFTLNIPEMISRIDSVCDDGTIDGMEEDTFAPEATSGTRKVSGIVVRKSSSILNMKRLERHEDEQKFDRNPSATKSSSEIDEEEIVRENIDFEYPEDDRDEFYSLDGKSERTERIYDAPSTANEPGCSNYSFQQSIDNQSPINNSDETIPMHTDEERDVFFPPTLSSNKLERSDETEVEREHSFKIPLNGTTEKQKYLDHTHVIYCRFPGCNKPIHWKIRYGKRRLFDHALVHCEQKWMGCGSCDYRCQTTSQMKYHYKKMHTDEKMKGFGISKIPYNDEVVTKLWDECFGAQTNKVGVLSRSFRRVKHKIKVFDEKEIEEKKY